MVNKNYENWPNFVEVIARQSWPGNFFTSIYTQFALPELRYEGLRGGDSYITVGLRV